MKDVDIDQLDSDLNTSQELEKYLKKVRDISRDMFMELAFAADILQANLSTLPVAANISPNTAALVGSGNHSKIRARKVARRLRKAAAAQKNVGVEAVRTWREFTRSFAPEIESRRIAGRGNRRPQFTIS